MHPRAPRSALAALALAALAPACFVDQPLDPTSTAATTTTSTTSTSSADTTTSTTDGATGTTTKGSTTDTAAEPDPCGDGDLDDGEACDDGNQADSDGCSATCAFEPVLAIFVSQGKFNGNAGPLAGIDAKCQAEASEAMLPGTFIAWLGVDEASAPAARIPDHDLPYVLPGPDRPLVAQGRAGLLGAHLRAVDRGPGGQQLAPGAGECTTDVLVWTGAKSDGTTHPVNCLGFTNGDMTEFGLAGRYGDPAAWTDACQYPCASSLPFYCLQQPD